MCGISGFTGLGNEADLQSMTEALTHRGPDATGYAGLPEIPLYLGHKRLSILDHSGGEQPMWLRGRELGLVFNGEIYNHLELRAELEILGHRFVSDHSDTETLLRAYDQWGTSMTKKLNGMFAFVIFDKIKKRLFGARDHFGQKPFYYTQNSKLFAFSSELSSLVKHPQIEATQDKLSLMKYFAHDYIPAPRTVFKDIFKLPAGQQFIFNIDEKKLKIEEYWDFNLDTRPLTLSEGEIEEKLRGLLKSSVSRCLQTDVPYGVFLSGGIDSSCIAKYATDIVGAPIHTFSIYFEEKSFDESEYSNLMAKTLKSKHHFDHLSINKAKGIIPTVLKNLDEPLGDASLIPTYLVSQYAKKFVTVVLGGDGGDELFAGYDPFKALSYAETYQNYMPRGGHQWMTAIANLIPVSHKNLSFDFKVKRFLRGLDHPSKYWTSQWMSSLAIPELEKLFGEKIRPEELFSEALAAWEGCANQNSVDQAIRYYVKMYMQNGILTKVDRSSMMNSLEVRAPFLDTEL
ncbi:MAG: asparagine synthase (glutamine-hydrolyzing), partial [Halobacteriovoraceae bacterium]|nr:asparagine synthase (glutamine-hydrolyzing) [Halobacteriovoraceae bacterium]